MERVFELVLVLDGEEIRLDDRAFARSEQPGLYSYADDQQNIKLSVEIAERIEGSERITRAVLNQQGTGTVKSFRYPIAERKNLATYDNLLMASPWGDNIPRPSKTIHDVASSPSIRFDQDYICYAPDEVIYYYPSIMAMQYMTLYNESKSFYLATYSTADETMSFHAKSTGKYSLELSVTHYPFLESGSWESPECAQAELGGGWHPAADLYRSHMGNKFRTPDSPAWMREDFHGWAQIMIQFYDDKPVELRFEKLFEKYREVYDATGINHLFLIGWHDRGHNTIFPRYLPNEAAGTKEELCEAIERIKAYGGKVALYTNARLIDIYGDFYKDGGKDTVCIDQNGQEYHEDYGSSALYAIACPGCPEYIAQMSSAAARISGEYGADGMFVDQISCNYDPFCYDKRHDHTKPSNNFLPGVEHELSEIRAAHSDYPEFYTFAEGCHERFGQFYDLNQGHGEEYSWQIGESIPEQFSYTYPDRLVTGMCWDRGQLYHTMAQFKPVDLMPSCLEDEENRNIVSRYVALRKSWKKHFLRGRFIDDEGFVYEKGVRLSAILAEDGSAVISLWRRGADLDAESKTFFILPEAFSSAEGLSYTDTELFRENRRIFVQWRGPLTYLYLKS